MGRKKANIDWSIVDKMLMAQCTGEEIADYFGIHADTLYRHCENEFKIGFTAYSQQKKSKGKSNAKMAFYKKAWIDGNTSAQIFWSKQYLGWRDNPQSSEDSSSELLKQFIQAVKLTNDINND